MLLSDFINQMQDAIDLPGVVLAADTAHKFLDGWDSLCVLNTIAMVDEIYGVTVSGRQIEQAATVADLFAEIVALQT